MTTKTDTASSTLVEDVRVAMRKAYQLGQTYWRQADSESVALNSESDETALKFKQLVADTCGAMAGAIGADKATDERIDLRALFEKLTAAKYKPEVARWRHLKNPDGRFQVSSIEMEFSTWQDGYRAASLAAVPASEPVLPSFPEDSAGSIRFRFFKHLSQAQRLEVFRALLNLSDKALAEVRNHATEKRLLNAIFKAAAPVSGMPDSQLGNLNTYWLTADGVAEVFVKLSDVRAALAAQQAPASTLTQSRDRALWTDEQRENHRKNKALTYRCTICCARAGEPHLPSCSEGPGICGVSTQDA